jgi:hypothetical protein
MPLMLPQMPQHDSELQEIQISSLTMRIFVVLFWGFSVLFGWGFLV